MDATGREAPRFNNIMRLLVVRGAPHPEPARRLLDYLAGPEVERRLAEGRAGFIPLRPETPAGRALEQLGPPAAMELTPENLLQQLEPSSTWTRQHFHP